jgi:serine/threonine protein kinase
MNMANEEEPIPSVSETPGEDLRRMLELGLDATIDDDPVETGQAIPQLMRIGDYELMEELGRGGMGVVYKARQCSLNRVVALKMILAANFSSNVQRLRFIREAELIASLRHPNIIAIHEIGEFEGQPYYSMDFIEGTSLKELLKDNALAWSEAARFAQVIAQAMQFAHEHGVIHRDLKPHNILVDHLRELHVADFGLARDLNNDYSLTMTGAMVGTPNYMSPEQSSGSGEILPSADVFAIGAILYEMLTALMPFRGGSLSEVLENVRSIDPIAPRLVNPLIPRDLNTVCLKCLQKEPGRRYLTAGELADDLDRVLRDIPIEAKPISSIERGWRWCKRNRNLASVISGSATIIVLGTVTAFIVLNQERIQAQQAELKAKQAQKVAESERNQVEQANADTVAKNKELQTALDEITHQKGVIDSAAKTDTERDLTQAVGLFHDLRLADAQVIADKIIAAHPDLPGAWYLSGQLALAQGNVSAAAGDLKKAAELSPGGLDASGLTLAALVNRYAATRKLTPDGKLTGRDMLDLLRDLQGKEEYFACVEGQQEARHLLLQSIRSGLAIDSTAKLADADRISISQEGDDVILTLKDIPNDLDLSSIKKFSIITALHLENTGISNLALAGMPLSRLEVINSPVSSLEALKGMPLQDLTLKGTQVKDLTPLQEAPLHSLTLDGVPFPPETLLQHWPLDSLQISGTSIPAHFVVPEGVRSLGLARTGLTDLQFVASSSLQSLDVSGNRDLSNLEPLRGLTTLRQLDLSDTGVGSILPLADLNLVSLSLRNTFVGQIACLKNMPLQELDLSGCLILDVSALPKLPPKYFPPKSR